MTKWEYCIFTAVETTQQQNYILAFADRAEKPQVKSRMEMFTRLGQAGWELTGVNSLAQGVNEFYFKRPLR